MAVTSGPKIFKVMLLLSPNIITKTSVMKELSIPTEPNSLNFETPTRTKSKLFLTLRKISRMNLNPKLEP